MTANETPIFDEPPPPEYQLGDDFEWDDIDQPMPTVVDAQLDDVNRMMRGMNVLARRIAEYTRLEQQDLDRIKARRAQVVDPWKNRFEYLESTVKQFAIRAWREEARGSFVLPNGSVKSSNVMDVIDVDDEAAAGWLMKQATDDEVPVVWKPKVAVGETRKLLDRLEAAGVVQRFISGPADGEVTMIEPGKRVTKQLDAGQVGRWMIIEGGDVVDGITWQPNGDDGVGRNFKVNLA